MSEAETYFDAVVDSREGYLCAAFGYGGHFTATGRYAHERWRDRSYAWPADRARFLADAERADRAGADVYVNPAPRFGPERTAEPDNALPPTTLWGDLDGEPSDWALFEKLGGPVVSSGSDGHRHVYVRLSRPVSVATWRTLATALRDKLGGDNKISTNDVLRLPGTRSFKSDPPAAVTLTSCGGEVWDPDALGALLGVDTASEGATHTGGAPADVPDREPAPDPLPDSVAAIFERDPDTFDGRRSGATYALVGACRDARLTLGQTIAVAETHDPTVTKYGGRRGGIARHVAAVWAKVDAGPTVLTRPTAAATGPLPTLPESFWTARPTLEHVRQAAHARAVSADVVLHATLARLASLRSYRTRVDVGLGPAVLNYYAAAVGASGAGKTTAVVLARELLPADRFAITGADGYRDGVPIGSGEGLAELYVGMTEQDTDEVYRSGPNKGEKRTRTVRGQVRHNALVYCDEGEALFRTADRKGATIMPTLRSAWTGAVLGQSNASAETTRVIPAGSYALGLVIGVQLDTAAPLFADEAGGTPQRFVFCSATDPAIPDHGPDFPGALDVAGDGLADPNVIEVDDRDVRARVRAEHLARHRGQADDGDPLDAHRPLHLAKVSALLALLDGRHTVTGQDWSLAETMWATSVDVRSALIARGREREREESERRADQYVAREERAALARDQASAKVARIAERLAARVRDGHETTTPALRKRLAGKERHLTDTAIEHAVTAGWITRGPHGFEPGSVTP